MREHIDFHIGMPPLPGLINSVCEVVQHCNEEGKGVIFQTNGVHIAKYALALYPSNSDAY